ncbi:usg protein [Afifella aestuarii]|uniref:usg protein n=1 Tax=Afifella aestuarii TaxID=1909496 RepID=UPI000FE3D8C3|nr:protein usg [Afifella aestuarii]
MQQNSEESDLGRQLAGYGLTTASVFYYMPERPKLIQSFVWQFYDVAPDHPRLERFLDYWRREIDAAIHSVEIAHERLIKPSEWRLAAFEGRLN